MKNDKDEVKAIKSLYGKESKDTNKTVTLDDGRSFIGWVVDGDDLQTLEQLENSFSDEEILDIYHERCE